MFQIAALVAWAVLFCIEPSFDWGVVLYSLGFGTCFLTCNIGIVIAMKTGPVSLTSLIVQLSLIATTVWGFFFWDTPFTRLGLCAHRTERKKRTEILPF